MRNRDNRGRVKVRVIELEVEGDDTSINESLRSINAALHRPNGAPLRSIQGGTIQRDTAQRSRVAEKNGAEASKQLELEGIEPETEVTTDDEVVELPEEIYSPGSKPKAQRRYASPKVLNDLDLNAGAVSLRDFVEQKKPDNENKRYLVSIAWLKEFLNVDNVTADHVYTCYRHMGWSVHKDVGQPLRKLKSMGQLAAGKDRGTYSINHIGLDVVNRMPKI